MAKRPTYLGGHTQTGSTVGFAGWGSARKNPAGVGLVGMAPAISETQRFLLLSADEAKPVPIPRFPINVKPKKAKKGKKNANRT